MSKNLFAKIHQRMPINRVDYHLLVQLESLMQADDELFVHKTPRFHPPRIVLDRSRL